LVKRKLIEVALPLEAINMESGREKSIRHGHPSTLHLWWSRKPTATARAVLFAQLVDDPSSHPEKFPTPEAQARERERLHKLIERLVVWENTRDESLLAEARQEILDSTDGNPPPVLDPFAGGGSIPLEAQRLGLEVHASDLNPVAVLINKALIEIPPKFRDQSPVFPGLKGSRIGGWKGAEGLAADVRAYGQWMRDEAEKRIGHLYPKAVVDGKEANVIAWIWARTVTCPNPACGIEMPLTSKWWLGKKKGREAYVIPEILDDAAHPSGKRVTFRIGHDPAKAPKQGEDGTVGRRGAECVACGTGVSLKYIREEGQLGRIGAQLMATVAEGNRRRVYLDPSEEHSRAAEVDRPDDVPESELPKNPRDFKTPNYGMTTWASLFTNRQLVALTTFSDLVSEARDRVVADAIDTGMSSGERLADGGVGAEAYGDAVATYLGLGVSRAVDRSSSISSWDSSAAKIRNAFGRQALPMTWDFAETAPFSTSTGNYLSQIEWTAKVLDFAPRAALAEARQQDAGSQELSGKLISTDPPYYDNIGYSDLSDFFYVWQRRTLRDIYPDLFRTMLVPKVEELVANPYRHDGREGAKEFFEDGFREVFARARMDALEDFPITVYYAFKQSDTTADGTSSSGWETLLDGMIRSGWSITATWPMRSELSNRMLASGTNALASSIVLALRPRPDDAPATDRRGFISALQAELPDALRELQQGRIAAVDLPQATIGPGMAVFSRYSAVYESDGSPMTVRSALARINEILDQVLSDQEGDFTGETRFAIAWYRQYGYGTGAFGDADNIARSRNTSVESLDRQGILISRAGRVSLIKPEDLPEDYDVATDARTGPWEAAHHLIRLLNTAGIAAAGGFLAAARERSDGAVDPDHVKELAYLLFHVAEQHGRTADALNFNSLVTSWADIVDASRSATPAFTQTALELEED